MQDVMSTGPLDNHVDAKRQVGSLTVGKNLINAQPNFEYQWKPVTLSSSR